MKKMAILARLALGAALTLAAVSTPVSKAYADHHEGGMTAELQKAIGELTAEQQASLFLLLKGLKGGGAAAEAPVVAAAPAGDPKEAGSAIVNGFFAAASSEDMEKMMSFFSEDFDHYEYGDKQGVKDFLTQAIDMGYMDGITSSTADSEFEVNGEEMTIYPVDVTGSFGSITFEYVLKKEGDAWKIIGFDAAGL